MANQDYKSSGKDGGTSMRSSEDNALDRALDAAQIGRHDREVATTPNPPIRTKVQRRPRAEVVATAPKLDVFPSPHPLSDQELALARYVRNFPADAKAVAKEQADSEKEVLAKMQALANESAE